MSDQDESKQDEPKADEPEAEGTVDAKNEPESEAREPARVASKEVAEKPREAARSRKPATKAAGTPGPIVAVLVVLGLLAGGAAGWFGHIQQSQAAAAKADAAPAGDGTSGPCSAWEQEICSKNGAESAACMQAKAATDLLTPSTCEVALRAMPATMERLRVARASCDNLVGKLCGDLQPGSATCAMVKERTQSFPAERCKEMLEHYDEVLGQLKQIEAQQGMMGMPAGPGPGMAPHGAGPHGHVPPGAAPPGMPPH